MKRIIVLTFIVTAFLCHGQKKTVKSAQNTNEMRFKSLVKKAVRLHPQVKRNVRASNAAESNIKVVKSGNMPSLDLRSAYGAENTQNETVENDGDKYRTLGKNVNSITLSQREAFHRVCQRSIEGL